MKIFLQDATATEKLGVRIGSRILIRPQWGKDIFLFGDVGAGKTSFVQGLAEGLGISYPIQSPTFALISHHEIPRNKEDLETLVHMDMYRLENPNAINMAEIYDEIHEKSSINAIEWSENFPREMMPKTRIEIHISRNKKDSIREANIEFFSPFLPHNEDIRKLLEEEGISFEEKQKVANATKRGELVAQKLIDKGRPLDLNLIRSGCLLHNASGESSDKTVELLYKKNFIHVAESLSYVFAYSEGKPLLLEEQCILAGILLKKDAGELHQIAQDILEPLFFQAGVSQKELQNM